MDQLPSCETPAGDSTPANMRGCIQYLINSNVFLCLIIQVINIQIFECKLQPFQGICKHMTNSSDCSNHPKLQMMYLQVTYIHFHTAFPPFWERSCHAGWNHIGWFRTEAEQQHLRLST